MGVIAYASGIVVLNSSNQPNVTASSIEKGLVGYWPLDGDNYNSATARVTDKGPYSNHGTNNGATLTTDRMGQSNGAMDFGTRSNNYYINVGNPSSLQITGSQTISMWLYPTNIAAGRQNPYNKAYGGEGTITQEPSGSLSYYYGTAGGNAQNYQGFGSPAALVKDNEWVHVVLVRDLENMKLYWYKNGVYANQVNAIYSPAVASSLNISFGTGYAGAYSGSIAEVRIYNRVLSADEINILYNSYKPKLSSSSLQKGLVLDMPLDSNNYNSATSRMTDKTPYSNHGTNNGATVGSDSISLVTNDWVDVPYGAGINPSINPQTFSIWVKPNSPASNIMFLSSGQVPNSNARMYLATYGGYWDFGIYTSSWGSGNLIVTTDWTHIGIIMNGTYAKYYVNGNYYAQKAYSSYTFNNDFDIGRHPEGAYYWNGNISDLKIYNRALSADEIKSLYDKGR